MFSAPAARRRSTPFSPRTPSSRRRGFEKLIAAIEKQVRIVYLEDIRKTVSFADKLRGALRREQAAGSAQARRLGRDPVHLRHRRPPKGVVLSHRNVLANVAQAEARIDFGREDRLFMALPAFHSFGFMGGIVLPLISGVPTYLYPSPLHYRTVPELVYGICATYLFGTDTFLAGYARMANAYDFRSLRYIVAGGEPIKESTRRIYLEKFGMRILEGYGVTETSPVLALNTPMFNKFGTVGRLLPGMQARLGEGRRRRGGRTALGQGAERDARLSARRQAGRARTAARGLVRHRRYRRHRRAGLHRHQRPRQALRQGRRRDDLARRRRDARGGAVAALYLRGGGGSRRRARASASFSSPTSTAPRAPIFKPMRAASTPPS